MMLVNQARKPSLHGVEMFTVRQSSHNCVTTGVTMSGTGKAGGLSGSDVVSVAVSAG